MQKKNGGQPSKRDSDNSRLVFETLENRMMFSAELAPLIPDDINEESFSYIEKDISELFPPMSAYQEDLELSDAKHLVIIDSGVDELDTLKEQFTQKDGYAVIVIDSDGGLEQLSAQLAQYQQLDAIHLLSHGEEGSLQLGGQTLNAESMHGYEQLLQTMGASLSESGDLLLYGCNLAGSGDGLELLERIALTTGADVAASNDLTGASTLDGDWDLEVHIGDIEQSSLAFSESVFSNVLSVDPVGSDFMVNTTTAGNAGFTTDNNGVAMDANGNFVVTWSNDGNQDGSGNGVFAQRYDALGTKVGAEFQVNTYTSNDQHLSSVAMNDSGEFVIVWVSNGQDGSGNGVYGQRYDASGVKVGSEFSVNTFTANNQTSPNVALHNNGSFVVVWHSYNQDETGGGGPNGTEGVFIQRFDTNGNKVGGEVVVNDYVLNDQHYANIDMNNNGDFIVSWEGTGATDSQGMYVQRFDNLGNKVGTNIMANTSTSGYQNYGDVAIDGSGNFVVVWDSSNGQDGNGYGIIGQRFDSAGSKVGGEFVVNSSTAGNQRWSSVTMEENGRFVIAWQDDNGLDGGGSGIFMQAYDVSGSTVGGETQVNTYTANNQRTPSLVLNDNGNMAVVWEGAGATDSDGIYGQVYTYNTLPTASNNTVATNEDTTYVFTAADFNFSDTDPGDGLEQVQITTLETVGALKLNGVDVTLNQVISKADIDGGLLTFVPVSNQNGTGYDTFGFKVHDGIGYSVSSYTMTVDVNAVNDLPTASNNTVVTNEDVTYVFTAADFNFADVDIGDTLQQIQIINLEGVGALKLNGVDVILNQVISRADIDAGLLTFEPVADQNGTSYDGFGFKVHDGTAYSSDPYAITIDVTPVNDAPTAINNTVATNEDTIYVFTAADFNFSDVDTGDTLQQIQIKTLETEGSLQLNGVDVTLNQVISRADIDAGLLTFEPVADQNGVGYDSFNYQVHDGTTYSVASYSMTIDVNAVNDAPTATNNTVATNEDTTYVFSASDFNFADVDAGDTLQQIQITSLETVGALQLNGVDVTLNQVISRADIDAGLLTFDPVADQNGAGYDSFRFLVHDGTTYSVATYTINIDVNAVNDAPTATNNTVATNEDTTYVFSASDFNFADVDAGDTLQQIQITSLETVGALKLNGVDVTLNQVISRADIDAGLLTFEPVADQNGVGYDSFDFRVHDGTTYSVASYSMTIDVNAVNDAPTATNNTVATNEDTTYVFSTSDFNFADVDAGDTLQQIQITSLETVGALKLNGVDVTLNQVISRADIDAGLLTFEPVADQNGVGYDSFDYQVHDGTTYSVASYSMTIDVNAVNDAPTATNNTVATNEDTTYVFSATDFNFADVDAGDTLQQIRVTTLETMGALKLNGVDVILNQVISRADIDAGLLTFEPVADQNGVGYDSFDFSVHDGTTYSVASYSMTIDVSVVNDAPTATNNTVATNEDTTYVFSATDFNFADVDAGDTLQQIQITSLETVGALKLNGVDVTLNQVISRADIDAGLLTFEPVAEQNGVGYDSFDYQVHDGTTYSVASYSMTIDVSVVNDAPTATNNTVATNEDTTYVFSATDFNFADVDAGDTLQQIQITSLETVGALKLNGVDVTLNQVISRADIDAGLLTFEPLSGQNGVGYDSFDFRVHDGTTYSVASYSMTIDVNTVNDAPTATNNTVATNEDTTYVFSASDFNFADVDAGDTLQQIQITSLETVGALKLNGVDVTLNQVISRADIDAGLLTFEPVADQNGVGYDSFDFRVHDGTTYSVASYSMTIDVNAVNDAPTATNNTVATNEDTTYVFSASDFNFADVDAGDTLQQIQITSLETVGALKLNGVDVTLNQVISRADIDAGLLTFEPVADQNGVGYDSFDFRVHDGTTYSVASYSMTIDVNAVNDAPTATNNTVATNEDTTYVFSASDFNFADVDAGDTLQQIQITSLETVGALKLNGVDVTLNQVISRADIDAGLLTFEPVADQNGVGYDSFDFRVHDGTTYSVASYSMTIDVNAVNDAPTATNNTVATNEDTTYVFSAPDFNFADVDAGDTLQQIQITSLETVGALKLNGVDVTLNQVISRADIDAGLLTFEPVADQNGVGYDSFDFRVHDGTTYSVASYSMTIDVNAVNDAPTATNNTVATNEDTTYVFSASDFNFADVDAGDTLQQIQITSLETVGALKLGGVDVTLNQVISRADIDAGLLTFEPVADQNGVGYDSFDFRVHDGTVYSAVSYSMTIDVNAVNDAPTATNNTVATNEDTTYVFSASDFNFADVDAGDTLQQIQITSLETVGALKLGGVDVTLNQVISRADIDAGLLAFEPVADQNGVGYDSFDFRVHDGTTYSVASYSMTIDVNAVNDAPTATNNTVATNEDTTYVFSASDFNFADVDAGDTLQQIQITSLETVGALKLNGVDVTLNQVISRADIDAGLLTFEPVADQNGVGYDSFDFRVHDGTVYSAVSYSMTIDVNAVNDAPTATNNTVATNEDTTYVFSTSDFNFADVDAGDTLQQIQITSLETVGALKLNGVDVTLNQVISRADIDAGLLTFEPVADQNGVGYDSFDYQVHDGTTYSVASYSMTIDVNAVNDAPTATNNTVATNEDTTYVFSATDFNFADVDAGDTLQQIQITSLETVGALKLGGVDVTLNQVISRADIDAGLLTFEPVADQNGVGYDSFDFRVHDGTTYSVASYSMTIDVSAVNDAPTALDNTVITNEDTTYVFSASDFNFADVDAGDTLQQIRVTTLETVGALKLNGVDVILNQVISRADIDAGLLTFEPVADQNGVGYDSFDFRVHDGTTYSVASYSMTIDVSAVNDAPTALDNTVITNEDTTYVFSASDFNFSDVDVGDTLQLVKVGTLPLDGVLKLNGSDVSPNQIISVIDIQAGLLTYSPAENEHGSAYAAFDFQVHDGVVYSAISYTMTIDVTSVNDTPEMISQLDWAANENEQALNVDVDGFDVDGDILSFSIEAGLDGDLFNIDPVTGKITFKQLPDFESPQDSNFDNEYEISVKIDDGQGDYVIKTVKVKVEDVFDNPSEEVIIDNINGDDEVLDSDESKSSEATEQLPLASVLESSFIGIPVSTTNDLSLEDVASSEKNYENEAVGLNLTLGQTYQDYGDSERLAFTNIVSNKYNGLDFLKEKYLVNTVDINDNDNEGLLLDGDLTEEITLALGSTISTWALRSGIVLSGGMISSVPVWMSLDVIPVLSSAKVIR